MKEGILDRSVLETPIAILDFETTGLTAGRDRVIEVSVARMEPGTRPTLVFDTLINPQRRVSATEIHGIRDEDVADAPEFEAVANDLIEALSGCVVAAYNVYFDMRFLDYELSRAGADDSPPHMCLMYLRPMLDLGSRCSLSEACNIHDVEHKPTHMAADDVLASARLMELYLDKMKQMGIRTFRELARLKNYKFLKSFNRDPLALPAQACQSGCTRLKSRVRIQSSPVANLSTTEHTESPAISGVRAYWDAMKAAVTDLIITDDEMEHLRQIIQRFGLPVEQIRMLHARVFSSVISQFIDDRWLDDRERRKLRRLHECLSKLGWAPGE